MVNFKFVKAQFKTVWYLVLIFALLFGVVMIVFPSLVVNSMGEKMEKINIADKEMWISRWGAGELLNNGLFSFFSFLLFWSFGISMTSNLLNKDISKGYIASWLTTPMSRSTIFNSKLFVLIASVLGINLIIIFLELILYSGTLVDFKETFGHLLLANFDWMCLFLLTVSIIWMVFSIFSKNGVAIGISMGILSWFVLCMLMTDFLYLLPGWEGVKNFKYLTIWSLFNSPLQFDAIPDETEGISPILPIKALDFAWQIPVMVIGAGGIYTGGQFIIKSKDFAF